MRIRKEIRPLLVASGHLVFSSNRKIPAKLCLDECLWGRFVRFVLLTFSSFRGKNRFPK